MTVNLDKGTKSRDTGSPETQRLWAECDRMNTENEPVDVYWFPVRAIVVDASILPRPVDEDTARHYAEHFRRLPPVRVQSKSLKLFSGRHRLKAAEYASSDYILAIEEDIPDDELADEAIRANVGHGKPYTLPERQANAKAIMGRHRDWGMPRVAEWSGVSVRWLHEQRAHTEQRMREAEESGSPVQNARVERPTTIVGRDGVRRPVMPPPVRRPAPVRTFDPGPEADPGDGLVTDAQGWRVKAPVRLSDQAEPSSSRLSESEVSEGEEDEFGRTLEEVQEARAAVAVAERPEPEEEAERDVINDAHVSGGWRLTWALERLAPGASETAKGVVISQAIRALTLEAGRS